MIKKKESRSWVIKEIKSIAMLILFISIIITIGYTIKKTYFPTTSQYCDKNPDKCVCEELKYECNKELRPLQCDNLGLADDCSKFRLKKQAELDIDDCNNNPRENEICRCEERQESLISGYLLCYRSQNKNGGINFKNLSETEFNKLNKKYSNDCDEGFKMDWYRTQNATCIKSRPKTECEKGNLSWREEINQFINVDWIYNCCDDIKLDIGNKNIRYVANKICFEADSNVWQSINTINTTKCESTQKIITKTICREKTAAEISAESKEWLTKSDITNITIYYHSDPCGSNDPNWSREQRFDINCTSDRYSPLIGKLVFQSDIDTFTKEGYKCNILLNKTICINSETGDIIYGEEKVYN